MLALNLSKQTFETAARHTVLHGGSLLAAGARANSRDSCPCYAGPSPGLVGFKCGTASLAFRITVI